MSSFARAGRFVTVGGRRHACLLYMVGSGHSGCGRPHAARGRKKESPPTDVSAGGPRQVAATYSPALVRSTIGAGGLNFSVRDGKRWGPAAIAA